MLKDFMITDRESCAKAIRNGGIAALLSTLLTTIVGFIVIFDKSNSLGLNNFISPLIFLDVILVLILTLFVFRKNRVAATLLFIYFSLSKIVVGINTGSPGNIIFFIIILLYYATAMRATFIWHSKYREIPIKENS